MTEKYDVIIIGAGPAGLSAGLYAARAKMTTLILEKDKHGGQIVTTDEVANYPGCLAEETGPTLITRMVKQCESFGAQIKRDGVVSLELDGAVKKVNAESGTVYAAKAIILATGASPRKIGCPGEKTFTGRGVSYCATCDADFFTDLEVYAIGGGDTALEEAIYLTKFARKVTVVHRRDEFRAAKSIVEKAQANDKIEFRMNAVVEEIKGDGIVDAIVFKDTVSGELTEVPACQDDGTFGVFVFVGYLPQNDLFKDLIELDDSGYAITNSLMETKIAGVYAAGDIRQKSLRQVVTAVADGAIAATQAEKYIESIE